MIFASRVLTLNKVEFLEALVHGETEAVGKSDYFNLGHPIYDPPLLRGSIILELNKSFLQDNEKSFEAASPIDTGSIKFGFFHPSGDKTKFLESIRCDFWKFQSLTQELFSLPPVELRQILDHKPSVAAKAILSKYFSEEIVRFMYSQTNPHAWLFEFSLKGKYQITERHVHRVFVPNTYVGSELVGNIVRKLKSKAVKYNPKYGMDQINYGGT